MRKKNVLSFLLCFLPFSVFAELKDINGIVTSFFIVILAPVVLLISWITLRLFRRFYRTNEKRYLIFFISVIALVVGGRIIVAVRGTSTDEDIYSSCMMLYFVIVGFGFAYKIIKERKRVS